MSMTIDTRDWITLDGVATGLVVKQHKYGTVVYQPESSGKAIDYIRMPHERYSLAHDAPSTGVPGRAQFEADLRDLLSK